MILVKNSNSPCCLFFLKIGLEIMFGDVLDITEALLEYKKCIS